MAFTCLSLLCPRVERSKTLTSIASSNNHLHDVMTLSAQAAKDRKESVDL